MREQKCSIGKSKESNDSNNSQVAIRWLFESKYQKYYGMHGIHEIMYMRLYSTTAVHCCSASPRGNTLKQKTDNHGSLRFIGFTQQQTQISKIAATDAISFTECSIWKSRSGDSLLRCVRYTDIISKAMSIGCSDSFL